MGAIDVLKEMQSLEHKKQAILRVINDIESNYYNSGKISFHLKTVDYRKQTGDNEHITFDKKLMKVYLNQELEQLKVELDEQLKKLSEVM